MESMGQDYNALLYTAISGTWGAAAGCVCRERLEENPLLPYYSYFRKHIKEKFPKMTKNLSKIAPKLNK
jgi:hypothetical protein